MHQRTRTPARPSSTSSRSNTPRTQNQRETSRSEAASASDRSSEKSYDRSGYGDEDSLEAEGFTEEEWKEVQKLNSIIQQFFLKSALTVVESRVPLEPAFDDGQHKENKWFNLLLNESEMLNKQLREWKKVDITADRPPPMEIEIYLDLNDLAQDQSLAISDSQNLQYDVRSALEEPSRLSSRPSSRSGSSNHLILERWTVWSDDPVNMSASAQSEPLSQVYKKGVPLFRSLYFVARNLPAFEYRHRMDKLPASHPSLKLKYRVSNGKFKTPRRDTLRLSLYKGMQDVWEERNFPQLNTPAGPLNIAVVYRKNCRFRIEKQESTMTAHFLNLDDAEYSQAGDAVEVQSRGSRFPGSLPATRRHDIPDRSQAYGSMSTYHQVGPPSSSPISALRAVRDAPSSSPTDPPRNIPVEIAQRSDLPQRRPSVSFQPFKAGSLSSSPAPTGQFGGQIAASPGSSLGRTSNLAAIYQPRNRSSLGSVPPRVPLPNETAIASSASASPKPAPITRYSSSFGHRRGKYSSGGASKTEEDNNSSGRVSLASSAQRGSDVMNEAGGSSGSVPDDDNNLSDFLKLLDQKRDLKSFSQPDSATRDASMRRTEAALSKFSRMRDSNAALSDSMSSSLLLHRSSSSSSRQLSAVPPMVSGTSVSTASSPGKPISPHTPHTPTIPSRLSTNSVIDYSEPPRRSRSRSNVRTARRTDEQSTRTESSTQTTVRDQPTSAIDIPNSPLPWPYVRRSSSASRQERNIDEDPGLFRSASLPVEERTELSLSELFNLHDRPPQPSSSRPTGEGGPAEAEQASDQATDATSSRPDSRDEPAAALPRTWNRNRLLEDNRKNNPSAAGRGSSRYRFTPSAPPDDDEPLLFTMSELGTQSRRSIEEGRGGSAAGSGERRRGGSGAPWR